MIHRDSLSWTRLLQRKRIRLAATGALLLHLHAHEERCWRALRRDGCFTARSGRRMTIQYNCDLAIPYRILSTSFTVFHDNSMPIKTASSSWNTFTGRNLPAARSLHHRHNHVATSGILSATLRSSETL